MAWWINDAVILVHSSFTPLVVIAAIPIRSPDGRNGGFGSSGMVDFEVEIQILSKVFSTLAPSMPVEEKSMITI
jgi:hypothetical protein